MALKLEKKLYTAERGKRRIVLERRGKERLVPRAAIDAKLQAREELCHPICCLD